MFVGTYTSIYTNKMSELPSLDTKYKNPRLKTRIAGFYTTF
jgi:hypothetical protein